MVNDLEAITSDFCIDDDFWRKVSCRSKREEEESDLIRKFSLCSSLTVRQDLSLSSFLETRERKEKESRKRRYLKTQEREDSRLEGDEMCKRSSWECNCN